MRKRIRLHDPKIEPPPGESVEINVEFPKDELREIDEAIREGGYWSRAEFFRAAAREGIRRYWETGKID